MTNTVQRLPTATALAIVHGFCCVPYAVIRQAISNWMHTPDVGDAGALFCRDLYAKALVHFNPALADEPFGPDGRGDAWKGELAAAVSRIGVWVEDPPPMPGSQVAEL